MSRSPRPPYAAVPTAHLECQTCGACCMNLPSNAAEGFTAWVEIEADAPLLRRPDWVRKLVVLHDDVPHLRLDRDQRCLALRGALGRQVSCQIYHLRPAPCRTVQPGDGDCLRARHERGIGVVTRG